MTDQYTGLDLIIEDLPCRVWEGPENYYRIEVLKDGLWHYYSEQDSKADALYVIKLYKKFNSKPATQGEK